MQLRESRKEQMVNPLAQLHTEANEVDQIVRDAFDGIYVGNVKDQEKAAEDYMAEYSKLIFEGPKQTWHL